MNLKSAVIFTIFSCMVLSEGCAVALEAEGGEIAAEAASGSVVEGLASEIEGLSDAQLADLSSEGILSEDIANFKNATMEIQEGRLISSEEVAFNRELEKIQLVRNGDGNPLLYIKGYSTPFGEVLPEEGRIKMYALDKSFSIHNNIFSVEEENVQVIYDPNNSVNNVVAIVHKGDLVVRLSHESGWYKVNILDNGVRLSGYIESAVLLPLIIADSALNDSLHTPYQVIKNERKRRHDYYWETMKSSPMTVQDAMAILHSDFGYENSSRKIANNISDWQDGENFLKMDYDDIPILNETDFNAEDLKIVGFTKSGEILQLIQYGDMSNSPGLRNPLGSSKLDNTGEWAYVKTLEGEYGWILIRPVSQSYSYGSEVKKIIPVETHTYYQQPGNDQSTGDKGKPEFGVNIIIAIIIIVILFFVIISQSKR